MAFRQGSPRPYVDCGLFCIVEAGAHEVKDEESHSMFGAVTKEIRGMTGRFVSHRRHYLAECSAIVGPVAVIPDLKGPANRCFQVTARRSWAKHFEAWLVSRCSSLDPPCTHLNNGHRPPERQFDPTKHRKKQCTAERTHALPIYSFTIL